MKRDDRVYLDDILEAIESIEIYTRDGRAAFMDSRMIRDAVIRNFQVIGEAAKLISQGLCQQYPDVPWRRMAGFRDVLVHDYRRLDLYLIWNVVENELPTLKPRIAEILRILDAADQPETDADAPRT